jgi:hypothetical protein
VESVEKNVTGPRRRRLPERFRRASQGGRGKRNRASLQASKLRQRERVGIRVNRIIAVS